jgi:hypothetical protein
LMTSGPMPSAPIWAILYTVLRSAVREREPWGEGVDVANAAGDEA